jgi:hypothetical protein
VFLGYVFPSFKADNYYSDFNVVMAVLMIILGTCVTLYPYETYSDVVKFASLTKICTSMQNFYHFPLLFNVENVSLRGYKWNKTVSNRIRYVSSRICNVSNEMCNTCATSYVAADNSRPMAYLILKVICK